MQMVKAAAAITTHSAETAPDLSCRKRSLADIRASINYFLPLYLPSDWGKNMLPPCPPRGDCAEFARLKLRLLSKNVASGLNVATIPPKLQ
jgi:hypothetical protein